MTDLKFLLSRWEDIVWHRPEGKPAYGRLTHGSGEIAVEDDDGRLRWRSTSNMIHWGPWLEFVRE